MRRRARFAASRPLLIAQLEALEQADWSEEDVEDDRLRLIFTCCHPALAADAQVPLTLREVCDLTTEEIARVVQQNEQLAQSAVAIIDTSKRQAEQVMYSSWSKAVQVLSRSAEDTQLVADASGGVREVPIAPDARQVLNDALVARLAAVGRQVKQRLGKVDQDIEWAVVGDRIIILQARPYIDARR